MEELQPNLSKLSWLAVWHWPRWRWVALVVPLFLLAYPLSTGPLVWMLNNGYLPATPTVIYEIINHVNSIEFACDKVPPLRAEFDWYLSWWLWTWADFQPMFPIDESRD